MEAPVPPVKGSAGKRPYDTSRRRDRARKNRERMVAAAEELFLADGYAQTTIAAIAARAGVSVDTIYKGFGGKPGLVRAIVESALAGGGSVHAEHRSDALQATESDPRKIIEGWGRFVQEISPRGSPILLLARRAAATDPELQGLLDELDESRLQRMTLNARRFQEAGHLRPDVTLEEAASVMWTSTAPELYELLVIRRGMTLARFSRYVTEVMIGALLP